MSRKRSRKRVKPAPTPRRQRRQPRRRGAPPRSRNERVLRQRILDFTYQERFGDDFQRAIRLYFGEEALQDNVLTLDEERIPGFQEWYIFDYITSEGEHIIDLFTGEVGPRLPTAQRQMLDDWRRTNRYRLFEVQKVEPGVGATVQDLLSGETLEVNDISSSYALVKWQVVVARPLLTEGRLCFTGSGLPLAPMEKPNLLEFAQELWKAYQAQHPDASLDDFYRDHGLDLYHRAMEITTAPPPPVYTPEGHPVMACTARYAVTDPRAVGERLDQAEEFNFAGQDADDPTSLHYDWLLRGRSHVPEVPVEGKGLMIQTNWTAGPGGPTYRSLGDVRLWRERLELSCLSQERLEAGKALLKQVLDRFIRHLGDECQDLETTLASMEPPPPAYEEKIPAEVEETLVREMMAAHRAEWLDSPVPALDGKSPRAASRDPAMREQLEELLKAIEYMEERRRRAGEPYTDVAELRRELGLPPR
jgi:hypothetical protein